MSEERPVWDSDAAVDAVRTLWLEVAAKAQGRALDAFGAEDTIRWAQLADAAYWQATGELDCLSIENLAQSMLDHRQQEE